MSNDQRYWNNISDIETTGHWATEPEAEEYLVAFLRQTGLFTVYRQRTGVPIAKHHFQVQSKESLRVDVLLTPQATLMAQGWQYGAIIIDAKRSGIKVGPGLNQLMDYMSTAWPVRGGIMVLPSFAFLFPARSPGGPVASIMSHQHIGAAEVDYHDRLILYCGHSRVLVTTRSGQVEIGKMDFGLKMGAR